MRVQNTTRSTCLLGIVFLWFFCSPIISAVPSPAEVIDVAKKGRLEFIKITNDLQSTIPQIATKEELYPLILALPELKKISGDLDFASFGADPVLPLAGVMTRNAVKWIRFDSDPHDFLTTFFFWSDDQTRFSSAHLQTDFVKRAGTKEALLKWSDGSAFALRAVRETQCEGWVKEQFEELQAQVVMAILKESKQFALDELGTAFSQLDGQMALSQVFSFIQQEVVRAKEVEAYQAQLSWLEKLSANVKKNYETYSLQTKLYPGQLMVDVLGKLLTAGESAKVEELQPILEIMLPTQWVDLGTLMTEIYSLKPVPSNQIKFVTEILGALKNKYEELNIPGRKEAIQQLADKILVSGSI